MNVMYAADDGYAEILATSVSSLCRHNSDVNLLILSMQITDEKKRLICTAAEQYGAMCTFCEMQDISELTDCKVVADRDSLAQFGRLFIEGLVPADWQRVLYLDCDTLVRGSLRALYDTDIDSYLIAGVEDAFSKYHRRTLHIPEDAPYINSGVMLINLEQWKSIHAERQLLEQVNAHRGRILQGDQGLISMCFHQEIRPLPLKWNVVTYLYDFTERQMRLYRKPNRYYSEEEIAEAIADPQIIHFTSSFASLRPWQTEASRHPYYQEWREIYEGLGCTIHPMKGNFFQGGSPIVRSSPFLTAVGFLHAYVKPMLYR